MRGKVKSVIANLARRMKGDAATWGVSVALHLLVFFLLATFVVETGAHARIAKVVSDLRAPPVEERLEELAKDETLNLEAPVSVTAVLSGGGKGGGLGVAGTSAAPNPGESAAQSQAVMRAIGDKGTLRPLAGRVGALGLDSAIGGLKGVSASGGSGASGDAGALDRISQELLRLLNQKKLLVAWVFDSSASLEPRRKSIADRFNRIYSELSELGVLETGGILTTVVAVGNNTSFLLDKPTTDVSKIADAIKRIKDDGTGKENLFHAVREAAIKYRRIQTGQSRTLVIVVITDEIGDDRAVADETVTLLKRNQVPVYVMGPVASFNRPVLHELFIGSPPGHPEKKYRFWIDVERGPYTRVEEILRVAFSDRPYLSGFGPFALTQLTRETGGIYFVYGDDRVAGAKADPEILSRYKANYGTEKSFREEVGASEFRSTLMEVIEGGNKIWRVAWPYQWLHEKVLLSDLEVRQKEAAEFLAFSKGAIPKLAGIEPFRLSEQILRWRASYDLSFARLLQAHVRCEQFILALAEFKKTSQILKDPKNNNGWRVEWTDKLKADSNRSGLASKKASKKSAASALSPKEMIDRSILHFDQVIKDHAGTPWAEAAMAEKSRLVGVTFVEGFNIDFVPPEEQPLREKVKVPKR